MNQDKIQQYLISLDFIQTAILFGSQVNGMTHAMSDIDIAILAKKEIPLLELGGIISNLEMICEQKVDLVVLNDLYHRDPQLVFNIIQKHKEIFIRNREVWNQYKTKSLLVYFDEKPILDKVNEAFRKRYAKEKV